MKNWLIKLLGGISEREHAIEVETYKGLYENTRQDLWREGDQVYVRNDERFDPLTPYYLQKRYNGKQCWMLGVDMDTKNTRELHWGVLTEDLSHEPPLLCPTCKKKI